MTETSASLLDRVRRQSDGDAWKRLAAVYSPLIRGWMRRDLRLSDHDAEDVLQEVLTVVARRVVEFDRQRTGSFRAWLKSITVNCVRNFARTHQNDAGTGDSRVLELLHQIEDPAADLSRRWDREHDECVMKQLLDDVRQHFTDTTWLAFQRLALENAPAESVAAELGVTTNALFIARSRVMARLRQEAAGLVD
jgi:RNA polymerase sigma-70 factor (ECF subfamily)